MPEDENVHFKIDDLDFDTPTTAKDGEYLDDALVWTEMDILEEYEVVEQKVVGFKAITQATEPEALKVLHTVLITFTRDDREAMEALDNYRPRLIQCPLFEESPLLMYLTKKHRKKPGTGRPPYMIEWDITLKECNDNNSV